jgi:hypothetical protein
MTAGARSFIETTSYSRETAFAVLFVGRCRKSNYRASRSRFEHGRTILHLTEVQRGDGRTTV